MRLILSPFFCQLTDEEQIARNCIQDNATTHISNNSMGELSEVFGGEVVGLGLWPPLSPDLNPCDFYLWSTLKDELCVYQPVFVRTSLQHEARNVCCFRTTASTCV